MPNLDFSRSRSWAVGVGRVGGTSGRPNLGRLAEGELAAFSKHSFVVTTLLYNNKDIILFLEIEKNAFSRKEEKNKFLPKQCTIHNI